MRAAYLVFWLLLAPGDGWTWVIVGGAETRQGCEQLRSARLDGPYLVCAGVTSQPESRPAARPAERLVDESS